MRLSKNIYKRQLSVATQIQAANSGFSTLHTFKTLAKHILINKGFVYIVIHTKLSQQINTVIKLKLIQLYAKSDKIKGAQLSISVNLSKDQAWTWRKILIDRLQEICHQLINAIFFE